MLNNYLLRDLRTLRDNLVFLFLPDFLFWDFWGFKRRDLRGSDFKCSDFKRSDLRGGDFFPFLLLLSPFIFLVEKSYPRRPHLLLSLDWRLDHILNNDIILIMLTFLQSLIHLWLLPHFQCELFKITLTGTASQLLLQVPQSAFFPICEETYLLPVFS